MSNENTWAALHMEVKINGSQETNLGKKADLYTTL